MIKNYPLYQNTNTLSNTDYIIVSTSDNIHNVNPIKTHNTINKCVFGKQKLSDIKLTF
jgi:hypothetical protein